MLNKKGWKIIDFMYVNSCNRCCVRNCTYNTKECFNHCLYNKDTDCGLCSHDKNIEKDWSFV